MGNDTGKKSSAGKWLFYLFLIIVIGLAITWLICNFTYSEGNRAGVLMKFSKKGYVFKTYEGELNIGAVGNVANTAQMNQSWNFSVRESAIEDTLMHLEGRKVSLHYRQVGKNFSWQGETDYFVDGVQIIN